MEDDIDYDAMEDMVEDAGGESDPSEDSELQMLADELGFDSSKTAALKAFIERCLELA